MGSRCTIMENRFYAYGIYGKLRFKMWPNPNIELRSLIIALKNSLAKSN